MAPDCVYNTNYYRLYFSFVALLSRKLDFWVVEKEVRVFLAVTPLGIGTKLDLNVS